MQRVAVACSMTNEEQDIWRRRRERALRWTGKLGSYPVVARLEDETEETLEAEPSEEPKKKSPSAP